MQTRLIVGFLTPLLLFPAATSSAAEGDIHAHGRALVQLVQEESRVEVSLTVPAVDVVGFEHLPRSDAEVAAVRESALTLGDVSTVLAMPEDAGCKQQWSSVRSELLDHLDVDTLAGHDDGHAAHGADQVADDGHGHPDFEAEWRLLCAMPEALEDLRVTLFDTLPTLKQLVVQSVTDSGQQETRLQRGDDRVPLK